MDPHTNPVKALGTGLKALCKLVTTPSAGNIIANGHSVIADLKKNREYIPEIQRGVVDHLIVKWEELELDYKESKADHRVVHRDNFLHSRAEFCQWSDSLRIVSTNVEQLLKAQEKLKKSSDKLYHSPEFRAQRNSSDFSGGPRVEEPPPRYSTIISDDTAIMEDVGGDNRDTRVFGQVSSSRGSNRSLSPSPKRRTIMTWEGSQRPSSADTLEVPSISSPNRLYISNNTDSDRCSATILSNDGDRDAWAGVDYRRKISARNPEEELENDAIIRREYAKSERRQATEGRVTNDSTHKANRLTRPKILIDAVPNTGLSDEPPSPRSYYTARESFYCSSDEPNSRRSASPGSKHTRFAFDPDYIPPLPVKDDRWVKGESYHTRPRSIENGLQAPAVTKHRRSASDQLSISEPRKLSRSSAMKAIQH